MGKHNFSKGSGAAAYTKINKSKLSAVVENTS